MALTMSPIVRRFKLFEYRRLVAGCQVFAHFKTFSCSHLFSYIIMTNVTYEP